MSENNGKYPVMLRHNYGFASNYFGCPECGSEVGGFVLTGDGPDDWTTHRDKFCKECGQKIDWQNTNWNDIYKL